ncbi:hypothetical protein [Rhizocola hellebori]|nr:hypothetical protein [Rhizocola hellebori]
MIAMAVTGIDSRPATGNPARPRITFVDLGHLGDNYALATAMNERGDAVGLASVPTDTLVHLFRSRDGVMIDIGVKGPFGPTFAAGIDNDGRVIGTYGTQHGDIGFLWEEGQLTVMPSSPRIINNRRQIVGGEGSYVWIWDHGTVTDITPPLGNARVRGFNDRGQVLLNAAAPDPGDPNSPVVSRGMLWDHGVLTDIGDLGGANTEVTDLNDHGWVTGSSETADGRFHAFVWQNGIMRDIGLRQAPGSLGSAINNRGQVAGRATFDGATWRPAVWLHGKMIDLGVDGMYGDAHSISEHGDTAGVNTHLELVYSEPFLSRHGAYTALPRPAGADRGQLVGINRAGTKIVGTMYVNDRAKAILWLIG